MNFDSILIRYSEIGLKSKQTRRRFENKLVQNIKSALRNEFAEYSDIRKEFGRIFIETPGREILKILPKVFGIYSISPVFVCAPTLEEIEKLAVKLAKKHIRKTSSFAIRARRTGEQKFTSLEICEKIGAAVKKATKAKVELKKPEKEIFVEARKNKAYVFTEKIKCAGGLPLGIEGKAVGIFSKGRNFKTAAWLIARRGCDIEFACFEKDLREAEKTAKQMYKWLGNVRVSPVKAKTELEFYKAAEKIALEGNAKALFSADVFGKNITEDLKKFGAISSKLSLPVFMPLIGMDKEMLRNIQK